MALRKLKGERGRARTSDSYRNDCNRSSLFTYRFFALSVGVKVHSESRLLAEVCPYPYLHLYGHFENWIYSHRGFMRSVDARKFSHNISTHSHGELRRL